MRFGSKLKVRHYDEAVARYEARPFETGKIIFFGDSLFTRCSDFYCDNHPEKAHPKLEKVLLEKDGTRAVINHGLGGSSADDLLYYYGRMVRPYKPRALMISTGGNDKGFGYTPEESMNIMATMIDWFRAEFPGAPVYCFTEMPFFKRPEASQCHIKAYNALLREYCAEKEGVQVIDMVEAPFFYKNAEDIGNLELVREDVYDEDNVHFNAFGYGMFIEFVRGILEKDGLL